MNRNLPGTRALRTFEAAARHLNFTRAADEVGLTPAAVSYQIKEIEDQLGIVLFARTSRSIQLTPAGAVLFEATTDALDTLHRAAGRARRIARDSNQLRLTVGPRFATHWLLPRLPQFKAAHPGLEFTFDITDQVRDFDRDDVDVAIRFGAGTYTGARSHRLFDAVVAAVCSPSLFANAPQLKAPRDLFTHTLCYVNCKVNDVDWPNWRMWMDAAGERDFDDSQCVAFADSSHVVQAVLDGNAVGLVELAMIAGDLARGRLVKLFDIGLSPAPGYAYHLVYPDSSGEDSRIVAFREWMLEEIARPAQSSGDGI
ncbi:LysR family transcriptional regulator [Steroidobacter agaridevorans]|uniref:LysR family transcriptional regulator n=1 Tax=Steroidobacter agaridevorans TaxID=2695856 RepID=A0A829YNE4_9GAMM|nr:LysR substrate-binding domain-containing protein [Steroidobacter agaridevorans]GFE84352.1 LysR family transcriptional regulator [Steroidobacter agaridevorans]